MTAATGAPVRVGLADAREGATRFYTHRVAAARPDEAHAVDRLLRVAAAFGADAPSPRFRRRRRRGRPPLGARRPWPGSPRPRLVLNVGARWLTKRWPPEHFAEVARRAVARARGRAWSPSARPRTGRWSTHSVAGSARSPCSTSAAGRRLPQLAALAAEADVFLSNDTGPLHLAAAAGCAGGRGLHLHQPRPDRPLRPRTRSPSRAASGAPRAIVKTCRRLECMAELTPDRVWPRSWPSSTRDGRFSRSPERVERRIPYPRAVGDATIGASVGVLSTRRSGTSTRTVWR